MKRLTFIALVSVMILSAFVLVSCGGGGGGSEASGDADYSDSKYVGTWKAVSMSIGDESEAPDGDWILTVNADGTGTLDDGEEAPSPFTWTPVEGGFKTKGDVKVTFKDKGDQIVANVIGVDLTFEKQ